MANEVYANGREVSCKSSDGKSICAFPDVCLSPPSPPAGPVPIPYPNTGMASDTTSGSRNVKISGKEVMLKNKSYFKKSTGDEAATKSLGMGVVTHQIQGKVYFTSWSMDVKIEGENVVRHLDLTTHNHMSPPGNTPPWPHAAKMTMPALDDVERGCAEAGKKAGEADKKIPERLKKRTYVVAGAHFAPGSAASSQSSMGASNVSATMVETFGDKYEGFAQGIGKGQKSNVPCPSSPTGTHQYRDSLRPLEGHAEAKISEDLFKSGRPQGVLYLKVQGRPICPDCKKLVGCAEESGVRVVECP